ncbi:unnamed protein product [Fraxinus pennsylvanica]|uniref:Uncharacterized protein n=1 Tax=Fraxinus pennsylvanica TaxID=56036 RepID=A0AAD1YPC4_9LAMI|nr:unnamed protein product [Fraxinus pennsylvanica]
MSRILICYWIRLRLVIVGFMLLLWLLRIIGIGVTYHVYGSIEGNDGTCSASFLMWDRKCIQLIGKTASTLNEVMVQSSEDLSYPNDIEALVDRKILFKVQVKQQNIEQRSDIFTVMRLTADDSLISKYVIFPNVESQGSDMFLKSDKNGNEEELNVLHL